MDGLVSVLLSFVFVHYALVVAFEPMSILLTDWTLIPESVLEV